MPNSLAQLFQVLPGTVLATVSVFLLCLLVGWISSITAGFRSVHGRSLRLLLIFPLSNPIALLMLWCRSRKVDWVPWVGYVVAVISLPPGGFLSERVERHRLERHMAALEQAGESVAVASLSSEPVPADENVWSHPFLEPLSPRYLTEPSLDPMTRGPWKYERTGERSFRLYSVGRNGIDESGLYTRGGSPGSGSRKDDLAWVITEQLPPLPEMIGEPPSVQLQDGLNVPAEMLRRYGLAPPDSVAAPLPTGPSAAQ